MVACLLGIILSLLQPAPTAQPAIADAPALLDALEQADQGLKTLTADIRYDKVDGVTDDRQIRRGKVFFEDDRTKEARARRFSVRFTSLQMGDRRDDDEQLFVFDGRWLLEVTPRHKQIIKREVAEAGSGTDPLRIGEGPLPLPIGQRKADILQRFDATLLPDADGVEGQDEQDTAQLRTFVTGSYQLRLVPKAGTPEAEKFEEIRLWYKMGDASEGDKRLLPRMARTVAPKSGNVTVVRLANVKLNTPIDPKDFAATQPGADWDIVVEPMGK